MARGDFVGAQVSIGASGTSVIQPGSGVEWLLRAVSMQNTSNDMVLIGSAGEEPCLTGANSGTYAQVLISIPIDNSFYAKFTNGTGGTKINGYRGYITKS